MTGGRAIYPRLQALFNLSDAELLEYAQFLHDVADIVTLDPIYNAPMRDPNDLIVLQTAKFGSAGLLCTRDADFFTPAVISYCAKSGIEICDEAAAARRLGLSLD